MEDIAIIEAIRNGSEKILFKLYDRYRSEFISWSVKNYNVTLDEAKDLFQDTIIDFHENILDNKMNSKNSSVKTYLFGIGKNKIRNYLRRKTMMDSKSEVLLKEVEYLNIEKEEFDGLHYIEKALQSIGERCKEIIRLFYNYQYSMERIAMEMNFKNSNVAKKTKYECMKKLANEVNLLNKNYE